jgi:hypothetical protein
MCGRHTQSHDDAWKVRLKHDEREPVTESAAPKKAAKSAIEYDLQFRGLEQIANLGVGGAGVTITLVGGVLRNMSLFVWMATIEFGLAALIALSAQWALIGEASGRMSAPDRARYSGLTGIALIGMAVGTLAASVFLRRS